MIALSGHAYAAAGRKSEATAVLEQLRALKTTVCAVLLDSDYFRGTGERDEAFAWLERAYDDHDSWMDYLGLDPRLDGLRSDARFAARAFGGPYPAAGAGLPAAESFQTSCLDSAWRITRNRCSSHLSPSPRRASNSLRKASVSALKCWGCRTVHALSAYQTSAKSSFSKPRNRASATCNTLVTTVPIYCSLYAIRRRLRWCP
jgi:hypothetical protein